MYLKSIEIQGFKSFANRTVLDFSKNTIGIVGPNGSGKSNIVDAIRWVLGEQSVKQLRGSKSMQDVIFNGTEFRKALNFAYVCITFDNSDRKIALDFDEVSVSRKLFSSGESKYEINGATSRLKDVNELFYDTGIGKDGYSIIGQGQIGMILSNKPEDRRQLFVFSFGIYKFKKRKAAAIRKLDSEHDNLQKVNLVVRELERQVGPLKKQAESADKYKVLHDELLIIDSNLFVRKMAQFENDLKDSETKKDNSEIELKSVQDKIKEFREKHKEVEEKITVIDQEVINLTNEISDIKNKRTEILGKINLVNNEISNVNEDKQKRENRIQSITDNINLHINDIKNRMSFLATIKSQIEFIKGNTESSISQDQLETDLESINSSISDSMDFIHKLYGDDYELNLSDIKNNENDEVFNELEEKRKNLKIMEDKFVNLNNEILQLNNSILYANERLNELDEEITAKTSTHSANLSKLETIKNLMERYEGFGNTIKSLMEFSSGNKSVRGVVADLISTDKKYEIAIEVALGTNIQNVVVDNEVTAKSLINYLKENKLGRITFLPLNSIQPREEEKYLRASNEANVLGLASDFVRGDREYTDIFKYLLGRCVVVEDYDRAYNLHKKYNFNLKIVTLSGELFLPGGSISGGAFKDQSNLLSRRREIDELSLTLAQSKNQLTNLTNERDKLKSDLANATSRIDNLKEDLKQLEIDKTTYTLNIVKEIDLQYTSLSEKSQSTFENLKRLFFETQKLFVEKENEEKENSGSNKIIQEKSSVVTNYNEEISKLDELMNEKSNLSREKTTEKDNLKSERSSYTDEDESLRIKENDLTSNIATLASKIDRINEKIVETTTKYYDSYGLTLKDANDKYDEQYNDIENLETISKEKNKEIHDLGPINLDAINEYAEVSERYETILKQKNDLASAEKEIVDEIKNLDESMRKQFTENFEIINKEFNKVFQEFFGGGNARLKIVEEEGVDILDAGIDIMVHPPGKKLSNLSPLSGGEKAFTAISLLFAIQNFKPSPFCFLDEIDAALDESNVDRFAEYLQKLSDVTQFILITHRRGTMERVDKLYGVTMQEKGVTTIVSVDMTSDKLEEFGIEN